MSEEIEDVEKRLEKLEPLEQKALAAKILENWQIVSRENSSPALPAFPPIFVDALSALPRSSGFASLSLGSVFIGAIVGAAATFLVTTFFLTPKVEIREIVREVRVQPEPATDVKAKPETELEADRRSSPVASGPENQPLAQPKARNDFDDRLTLSGFSFRDVDALVAQQEAFARQMGRRDSNVGSTSRGFDPPRISPEEYRELLRELKL